MSGRKVLLRLLVGGAPSYGFQLVFDEGDNCEVTGKPRQTIVTFPCDPGDKIATITSVDNLKAAKAFEGEKKDICHYHVNFPPSQFGCPFHLASISNPSVRQVEIDAG